MKKRILSIVAIVVALTAFLCACNGSKTKGTYAVTVTPAQNGVITVDKERAKPGDVVTATATPDTGYYLSQFCLNGSPSSLTFTMPKSNVVLLGVFEKMTDTVYGVTVDCSEGGTAVANVLSAKAGDTVTLTVTADELCAVNRITLNGERIEGTSFTMPEGEAVVYVEFVKDGTFYTVSAQNAKHGVVVADVTESRAGGTVVLDYFPVAGYVFDCFTLNGGRIEGNSFTMPQQNVTVSALFTPVMQGASAVVSSAMASDTAYSHWYFEAKQDGLHVTAKVMDAVIITENELQYRDYVEVVLHNLNAGFTWKNGSTVKLTVTADGSTFVRRAIGENSLSNVETDFDFTFMATAQTKQVVRKDGYTGYEVTMVIPYEVVGLTYATAAGSLAVCPAMNNAESVVTWNWEPLSGCTWFNPTTYLVVHSDGSVK